jgi:hypothetical protein
MGVTADAMGILHPIVELGRVRRLERGLEIHAIARVRLSKIAVYLVDNVSSGRLSDFGHAVNDKAGRR